MPYVSGQQVVYQLEDPIDVVLGDGQALTTKSTCYMLDKRHKMVAKVTKIGSLYQLNHKPNHKQASFAEKADTKEDIWHKRFGHLGIGSLQKLAHEELVDCFDFDATRKLTFCKQRSP